MLERDDRIGGLITTAYETLLRDAPAPPSLERLLAEPPRPIDPTATPPRRARLAVSAAVAAGVVVVAGLLLMAQGNDTLVLDRSSAFGSIDFRDGDSFLDAVRGEGVLVGIDDGFVVSTDGLTWNDLPAPDVVGSVADLVAGDDVFVAVGSRGVCAEHAAAGSNDQEGDDCPDRVAAVWTSSDGFEWRNVPHDEAVFGGPGLAQMNSVTVGGPGFVAVGRVEDDDGDADAAVWTSIDGSTWLRVEHDEGAFGGEHNQDMLDVVAGGPGVVAVGRDGRGLFWGNSTVEKGAVWISPDGEAWARVPPDDETFSLNTAILAVTATEDGLIAVGSGKLWVGRVWASVDGLEWTTIGRIEDPRGAWISDVAVSDDGLTVAVGVADDTEIWTSPDGVDWVRDPTVAVP